MDLKSMINDVKGILSMRFLLMMIIIAIILLVFDCKRLKSQGLTKDSKMAKLFGIVYLILGVGLFLAAKFISV